MNADLLCAVCGGTEFRLTPVLWPALIDEWQISPAEVRYIDRQQGECCTQCGANLRSIALALALSSLFGSSQPLARFVTTAEAAGLRVLEINEAGTLGPVLSRMPGHMLVSYPETDMHSLPFEDGSFDAVVHSDTLEHVVDPVHALVECRRVLKHSGGLCFTIPIIVGRLTRSRAGLPPSYHGNPEESGDDFAVQTEFGADAWTYVFEAGFRQLNLFSASYPAATAMLAMP